MIYSLNGELLCTDALAGSAVIECAGVGYKVTIPANTLTKLPPVTDRSPRVRLYTHMQVREDGVELFGFSTEEELSMFRMLISVSGVGPKAAISILSLMTPEKLARAEHEYKVDRIHRLFGLDKKLVDKYMRMGYASHQVKRAMFLARHCDKSVEELLAMKTRQQKWGDICEQLGLPRDACMK